MVYEIITVFELLIMFTGLFMAERYVFLESGLEKRKQRLFYGISMIMVIVFNCLFDDGVATYFMLIAGGLNISLARKEHRIRGFFLIIPIAGIIDGIIVPVLVIPSSMQGFSEYQTLIYSFIVYGGISFLMLLFWIKGKKWRKDFEKEMEHRHIHTWERLLLCAVGMLMMVRHEGVSKWHSHLKTAMLYR